MELSIAQPTTIRSLLAALLLCTFVLPTASSLRSAEPAGPVLTAPAPPPVENVAPHVESSSSVANPKAPALATSNTKAEHQTARPVFEFPSAPNPGCRPADQIWLVSSRNLGCPSSCNVQPELQYYFYSGGCWHASDLESFLATDDLTSCTTIYVHGNRVTAGEAKSMGLGAYRQVVKTQRDPAPLRFVIYSWPSDPTHGILRDVRVKADRANAEGYYLAWLIDHMQPSTKITLIGYSYGARIVTGSLHALGGGRVVGRALSERVYPERAPLRAVLMAAAVDNDWIIPGHAHGQALTQLESLLIVVNPCDRVLRRYRFVADDRPEALGYTGLPRSSLLAPYRPIIKQVSICDPEHNWMSYMFSSRILGFVQPLAFWDWNVFAGR